MISLTTIDTLIGSYDALLLDAYGVLVHRDGPLPGASELIAKLNRIGKPYYLLSNTAARLPEYAAERYLSFGLALAAERIITSGSLLAAHFAAQGLRGKRCAVLGPEGSHTYAARAGGVIVPAHEDFEVLLIGDQAGFPFLEGMDAALSRVIERLDRDEPLTLLLPNPDLIYPKARGFGITSGAMALVIESVLRQRYPDRPELAFIRLGKPEPAMFEEAARRLGTRNMVMIGDQLETDILGANRFGIDSALVAGGVAGSGFLPTGSGPVPTYRLESLMPFMP